MDSQARSVENKPRPVDPDYHTELNIVTHNQTGEGDIPFDFLAEALENEPFVDWSPLSLIRAFGYNSTYANNYVEEFLKLYPKFETRPSSTGQDQTRGVDRQSTSRFILVNGKITASDPNGDVVPVYGINATAFEPSDFPPNYLPLSYNGVPSSDITDRYGLFHLIAPANDVQGDGTTPDLIIKAFFHSDDFSILHHGVDSNGITIGNSYSVSSVMDTDVKNDITGPIFNYGTFQLPTSNDLSRSSYILNSLQPVNDWYSTDVGYPPRQSVIHWTPGICAGVGIYYDTNIMSIEEKFNAYGMACEYAAISPLANPHTLRHEYAHQIQNRIYLDKGTMVDSTDCGSNSGIHTPVHFSGPFCAWTEGWAFFMATAYDQNPIYQPSYMHGQWNFEDRSNTETMDALFANKDFASGNEEGNVAAALYDIIDTVNEDGDDLSESISTVWGAMINPGNTVIRVIDNFKTSWDRQGHPSLDGIFELNTLPVTVTPPPPPIGDPIASFTDDFQGDLSLWDLSGDSDWEIGDPDENLPGSSNSNESLISSNCDSSCIVQYPPLLTPKAH